MINTQEALAVLKATVKDNTTHQDYERTVALAKQYTALISGHKVDELLQQFVRRESQELFDQRKKLTQAITPAISEAIMVHFQKAPRSNRIYATVDTKDNRAKSEILAAQKAFWGDGDGSGLDGWMQSRYLDLVFTDPNAFLAVEFDPFDPAREKAKPKPVEISSEQAINYEYKNGILQWLIARWPHQYLDKDKKKANGWRWVMYLNDDAIELTQVHKTDKITDIQDPEYLELGADLYVIQYYQPKSKMVPCIQVGYKRDLVTKGRTFVSPIHPALPYYMKSLKAVSELDLTSALHAFPQKFQYVTPCPGEGDKGCKDGKTRAGAVCGVCHGTGAAPVHTSAQDAILLPIPRDKTEMINLEGMAAYKAPGVDLIRWQMEYVDYIKGEAIRAVYNSESVIKATIQRTATEKEMDMESIYDTLTPFARRYSSVWTKITQLIAVYTENEPKDLVIYHKFPSDFKLKSQRMLVDELKAARESGADPYVVEAISSDLTEQIYADDPDTLAKLKVKKRYWPFTGRTPEQIQLILVSDLTTRYNKVLASNFEDIFSQIDMLEGDGFYLLEPTKQAAVVKKYVEDLIKEIDKGAARILPPALPA